jgi:hypothetical protein
VAVKVTIFWDITPCTRSSLKVNRLFGGIPYLHPSIFRVEIKQARIRGKTGSKQSIIYLETVVFLEVIHRQNFISISETRFCFIIQVELTQLDPIDRASSYLRTPTPAPTQDRLYKLGTAQIICES